MCFLLFFRIKASEIVVNLKNFSRFFSLFLRYKMNKRKGEQEIGTKKAKKHFEMNYLIQNPGLDHLSEKIFQLLNVQTIARCRLGCFHLRFIFVFSSFLR